MSQGQDVEKLTYDPSVERSPIIQQGRFNERILKKIVIDSWEKGGHNRPVKVTPFRQAPGSSIRGYITQEKYIIGRTPTEIEQILGLPEGTLSHHGALIKALDRIPSPNEFKLRAYTQLPGGQTYVPGQKYPIGSGVPQWELIKEIPATTIRYVAPDKKYIKSFTPVTYTNTVSEDSRFTGPLNRGTNISNMRKPLSTTRFGGLIKGFLSSLLRILPPILEALYAASTVLNAIEYIVMSASALSGEGYIFPRQRKLAEESLRKAEKLLSEYQAYSDDLALAVSDQVYLGIAAKEATLRGLGPEARSIEKSQSEFRDDVRRTVFELRRFSIHVSTLIQKLERPRKEALLKEEAGKKILDNPKAIFTIQLAKFEPGTLTESSIFLAVQDFSFIFGHLNDAIEKLRLLSKLIKNDIDLLQFFSRPS